MESTELRRRDAGRARLRLLPAQQARRVGGVPRAGLRLRARPDAARALSDPSRTVARARGRSLVVEHEAALPARLARASGWSSAGCRARRAPPVRRRRAAGRPRVARRAARARRRDGRLRRRRRRPGWPGCKRAGARRRSRDGVPTLGICLGHQLLAVASAARSARNPRGQQLGVLDVGWTAGGGRRPAARPRSRRRRRCACSGTTTSSPAARRRRRCSRARRDGELRRPGSRRRSGACSGTPRSTARSSRPWADDDRDDAVERGRRRRRAAWPTWSAPRDRAARDLAAAGRARSPRSCREPGTGARGTGR